MEALNTSLSLSHHSSPLDAASNYRRPSSDEAKATGNASQVCVALDMRPRSDNRFFNLPLLAFLTTFWLYKWLFWMFNLHAFDGGGVGSSCRMFKRDTLMKSVCGRRRNCGDRTSNPNCKIVDIWIEGEKEATKGKYEVSRRHEIYQGTVHKIRSTIREQRESTVQLIDYRNSSLDGPQEDSFIKDEIASAYTSGTSRLI